MLGATAAGASADEYTKEYEHAYEVGVQGYIYGEPLLNMQRLYQSNTSVTVPDSIGDAPANQWSHFTELATTKEGEIIAPNADTLYSYAWLSLKPQPIVVHVPVAGRFNVVPIMTPYEENIGNIGEDASGMLAPGNYVIAGPGRYSGEEEVQDMKIIHSPYDRVWLVARTVVNSKEDTPNADSIKGRREARAAQPLEEGRPRLPATGTRKGSQDSDRNQGSRHAAGRRTAHLLDRPRSGAEAIQAAGRRWPRGLEQLKSVGIGPGKSPANNAKLSAGTLAGLRASVAAGPGAVASNTYSSR